MADETYAAARPRGTFRRGAGLVTASRARERLLGRLRHRKARERERLFLVEGVRSAREALVHEAAVRFAMVAPGLTATAGGAEVVERLAAMDVDVERVGDRALASLAATDSPQGVLLVCDEPAWGLSDVPAPGRAGGRALILDGLQDPGNLGTLARSADAFGVGALVALDGTVDPWNAKAVRAAAGALFRLRVVRATWTETEVWLAREGVTLLVGEGAGADVAGRPLAGPWALAVGNEGAGARSEVRAAGRAVAVPMRGAAESLNAGVAGSILLYALTREALGA